jgi:hypothetical protein
MAALDFRPTGLKRGAAKLYFDCHDALRAERKRRYEVY